MSSSSSSSSSTGSSSSSSKAARMLLKFESKSNRVKGLSFHCRRPWILASLHNGVIQLWDYRMEVLIDKFEEHDGPVRGIHFHSTQPLFVSGGDDYKIKVWNYAQRRCLFNLLGHLDYIRTVQFHTEYPWILSASDDQTLRIWNWQSRQCLHVLTGHNHYVMCAQFHPKEDLILSASLDQTVRVWDVSGLRKKTVSIAADFIAPNLPSSIAGGVGGGSNSSGSGQADLFGASDVIVKHVLEGHSRGVNWASFHRSLSLIVSGADDREVKLWRMNDSKAWEVDTMRGHINNVSCVIFHPKKEAIISNSEDKTIRVWDISKQNTTITFRRDNDRYWILDAHPTLNLLAAGHDSGLLVFKLNRERPPYDCEDQRMTYYVKDMYVYEYNVRTAKERAMLSTRRRGQSSAAVTYRNLQYNQHNKSQHAIILTSDADASYELYVFAKGKDDGRGGSSIGTEEVQSGLRGFGKCAVFVSRNRFAVLDKSRQLTLKTLKNESKRKLTIPNVSINYVFPAGIGRLLLRTSDAMLLYDIASLRVLGELTTASRHPVKYVCWSADAAYLALFSKANIYITNGRLEEQTSLNENSRIKSGAWDSCGVFVYTTQTHIKYLLPNGESGIIRTLDTPVYITHIQSNSPALGEKPSSTASASNSTIITYLDREVRVGRMTIDATEYLFKIALARRRNREVLRLMQSKRLVGETIIAYLHAKGFPEVALHFVEDLSIKFSLALECGNIAVALDCAQKLDEDECWHKLGVEALRQGNHQVVEAAYQKTKNFERLSFLYLITGNIEKLSKMLHIATWRNDPMGRFHNALYLGNVHERVAVLRDAGHLQLAYLTAMAHGMEESVIALTEELGDNIPNIPDVSNAKLFTPLIPILKESNWPLLEVRKGFFERLDEEPIEDNKVYANDEKTAEYADSEDEGAGDADNDNDMMEWGDDKNVLGDDKKAPTKGDDGGGAAGDGWGDDLELELPEGAAPAAVVSSTATNSDYFVMPLPGKSILSKWSSSSPLAVDMIAAGSFDMAMHLLNRQIGIVNFAPLKEYFIAIANSAIAHVPLLPADRPLPIYLRRTTDNDNSDLPDQAFKLAHLTEPLKAAYKSVTNGKFQVALKEFTSILHTIPFIVCEKKAHVTELTDTIAICREYLTAVRIELKRRETTDPVAQCAFAAYFTQTRIQPSHLALGLRSAIKFSFKINNFILCGGFCRRALELLQSGGNSLETLIEPAKMRSYLAICDRSNTDAQPISYKDDGNFQLCTKTLAPISRGTQTVKCAFCGSIAEATFADTLCATCNVSKLGVDGLGLKAFAD